jgi:hypothetical protein
MMFVNFVTPSENKQPEVSCSVQYVHLSVGSILKHMLVLSFLEINVVMDLSKKMRLKLGATSEPVKPLEKPSVGLVKDELVKPSEKPSSGPVTGEPVKPPEKPSAGPVKDEPMKPSEKPSAEPVKNEPSEPALAGENNRAPRVSQTTSSPNNAGIDAPVVKHDNSEARK